MNYHNGSQFGKVVYFSVQVNGKIDMIPMQVNDDGSLKYLSRYIDDPTVDSESSI